MAETALRLKIYRFPAVPARALRQFGGTVKNTVLGEQIYCWTTGEDVYQGLKDDVRPEIQQMVAELSDVENFPEAPMDKLRVLMEQLEALSADEDWLATSFTRTSNSSELLTFGDETRLPPTLAFAHHLRWICETFGNTPNLAVVIE